MYNTFVKCLILAIPHDYSLGWVVDGKATFLDCDINAPTMPCPTLYDGQIGDIVHYLRTDRPVGWTDELSKLQDMSTAAAKSRKEGQDSWPVKFRNISPGVVLPRQVRTYAGHGRQ